MKIKEIRESRGLKQHQVLPAFQSVEPRVSSSVLSHYENGISIPTPLQLTAFCQAMGVKPSDVYTPEELNFGVTQKKKDRHRTDLYRVSARVAIKKREFKKLLKACGYATTTQWINSCIVQLNLEAAKKKAASCGNRSAAHENNSTTV